VSEADFAREVDCPARRAAQLAIVRLHNEHYAICRLKEAINLGEKRGYIVKALALLFMALFLLACGPTPPTLKTVPVATGSPPVKCC